MTRRRHANRERVAAAVLIAAPPSRPGPTEAARASIGPAPSRAGVAALRDLAGGRAAGRLIQAKLQVGPARDRFEVEADAVAAQIVGGPAPQAQREATPAAGDAGFAAPAHVEAGIAAARGGGAPLPGDLRRRAESTLGADLSAVRLHAGERSQQMNEAIGAAAFTAGTDVHLSRSVDPSSAAGRLTVAHEVAHVAQQGAAAPLRRAKKGAPKLPSFKKPKAPKGSSKLKDDLEKVVNEGGDTADADFQAGAANLAALDADYLVALVNYKVSKYKGTGIAPAYWLEEIPDAIRTRALDAYAAKAASGPALAALITSQIHTIHAHLARRLVVKLEATDRAAFDAMVVAGFDTTDAAAKQRWFDATATVGSSVALAGLEASNQSTLDSTYRYLTDLGWPAVSAALRGADATFAVGVLQRLKTESGVVELFKDRTLLDDLAARAPTVYEAFVAKTPQLAVVEGVKDQLAGGPAPTADDVVRAVFLAVIGNQGIPLTYFSNRQDQNRVILTGGTDQDASMRADQAKTAADAGAGFPAKPATQCHDLLHILTEILGSYPNLALVMGGGKIDDAALTVPLSSLPRDGLLPRSFGGNVFREDGTPTGQVIFTGDEGTDSHSWVKANGVDYDPVLGTMGAEVAAAVAGHYEQVATAPGVLLRDKGATGWYLAKTSHLTGPAKIVPPSNPHGFLSGYVLTKAPSRYGFTGFP